MNPYPIYCVTDIRVHVCVPFRAKRDASWRDMRFRGLFNVEMKNPLRGATVRIEFSPTHAFIITSIYFSQAVIRVSIFACVKNKMHWSHLHIRRAKCYFNLFDDFKIISIICIFNKPIKQSNIMDNPVFFDTFISIWDLGILTTTSLPTKCNPIKR